MCCHPLSSSLRVINRIFGGPPHYITNPSHLYVVTKACETPNPESRLEYLPDANNNQIKKFYIETHGCQMNLADSDIIRSVLSTAGYHPCDDLEDADLILTNTCAIRENAENKIWQRLKYFASLRKKNRKEKSNQNNYPMVGVLGCMAERLKMRLLNEEGVDFIAGPDSYRDLPTLLSSTSTDQKAANVQLSIEETYSDIQPVRANEGNTHAFVTITRGCDNHCAFCIVPYVRGRERSRPPESIIFEVEMLKAQGIKEVVLLGQNVNSYNYLGDGEDSLSNPQYSLTGRLDEQELSTGFTQPCKQGYSAGPDLKSRKQGVRFEELLKRVAEVDPEIRIRFQSPHPKDFPDDLLHLIAKIPNICNSLHMPAQHGSSSVLERMRRGYSREAYISLVDRARHIIGRGNAANLGISSDFISGFCGETEEEHCENVSLLREVGFDQAFTYSYSRRDQTFAGLFMKDDIDEDVKSMRLQEMIDTFQSYALSRNIEIELGRLHVVLVEGTSRKGHPGGEVFWTGRTDTNKRVVFKDLPVLSNMSSEVALAIKRLKAHEIAKFKNFIASKDVAMIKEASIRATTALEEATVSLISNNLQMERCSKIEKGTYVVVKIAACRGHTLSGVAVALTTLKDAHELKLSMG